MSKEVKEHKFTGYPSSYCVVCGEYDPREICMVKHGHRCQREECLVGYCSGNWKKESFYDKKDNPRRL